MSLFKKILFAILTGGFGMVTPALAQETSHADPVHSPTLTPSSEVLIFVSFSMPIKSIEQWSTQAQKINAPLIIRGLVNDSFTETQKKIAVFSQKNQGGVVLDPRLFREYGVTQVPAVVVHRINKGQPGCSSTQSCWQDRSFDVVTGDVGLESALQAIADHGDSAAELASQLLAQWRRHE